MLASRRYNGSRSRKTKGSLADTLQCNIWMRAQTPHRMTHCLHCGDKHSKHNGFTALGKTIGTCLGSKSNETDAGYVTEHWVLKYLRNKIAHYLHDYRRHWFAHFRLPPPNGEHDQLRESQILRLMRRVQQRFTAKGGGCGSERPEVSSRLDIGHKDFFGEQFVNCRPFRGHH